MPAKKSPSKRKRPAKQKAGGGCPGANCSEFAGIQALIQIREALGDPCGKLMQDELVDKVLNLIQGEKELREGVITYIKDHEDESVDELKYLLDYTQWWDWDFTPPNADMENTQDNAAVSGSVLRLVRLASITETITAEAGWVIDWWPAGRHCPECGKHGRERAGAEFQHMDRCTDCGHVWTPETWYLRIRQPNQRDQRRSVASPLHRQFGTEKSP